MGTGVQGDGMWKTSRLIAPIAALTVVLLGAMPVGAAQVTAPRLGTALNFTVLAGSTITNTGPTVIAGNLGLSPGSAVTGFPPGSVTGVKSVHDAVALNAKSDLVTAYTDAANARVTSNLTGKNLGGKNLTPGVYKFNSSAQLTGTLTLSGKGIYIFQVGSTLTTASGSVVRLVNSAQACAVYWQIGSSATLGTATHFQGNLMALTSITMTTGANILTGRALARNGALTLDHNSITAPRGTCTTTTASSNSTTTTSTTSTPNTGAGSTNLLLPGILVSVGFVAVAIGCRRMRATR